VLNEIRQRPPLLVTDSSPCGSSARHARAVAVLPSTSAWRGICSVPRPYPVTSPARIAGRIECGRRAVASRSRDNARPPRRAVAAWLRRYARRSARELLLARRRQLCLVYRPSRARGSSNSVSRPRAVAHLRPCLEGTTSLGGLASSAFSRGCAAHWGGGAQGTRLRDSRLRLHRRSGSAPLNSHQNAPEESPKQSANSSSTMEPLCTSVAAWLAARGGSSAGGSRVSGSLEAPFLTATWSSLAANRENAGRSRALPDADKISDPQAETTAASPPDLSGLSARMARDLTRSLSAPCPLRRCAIRRSSRHLADGRFRSLAAMQRSRVLRTHVT